MCESTNGCDHLLVKCLSCGAEGSPAHFLGQGKKKTMSEAAIAARKLNASKPRPSRRKLVPETTE